MLQDDQTIGKLIVQAEWPADGKERTVSCASPSAVSGEDTLLCQHTKTLINRVDGRLKSEGRLIGSYIDDLVIVSHGGPCLEKKPGAGS